MTHDGPDLADVARLTGLSETDVVAAHTGTPWTVAFGGFAPGFSYVVGGDPRRLAAAGAHCVTLWDSGRDEPAVLSAGTRVTFLAVP